MSSVKKIRNGLFCVTWEKRPSPIISKPKENVPVTNVISGYTSCYLEVRVDGESLVLDTKLVPSEENKIHETELEKVLVIATYQKAQVKMKLFKGFKWQARWNFKPNICAKCEMAKSKTQLELFELVFDFQANPLQEKTVVDDSVPFHLGRSLMNNTSLADITFKCGNQSFHAHSLIILSCCSPELISMFQAAKSQENPDVLKTSDQNTTPKTRSTKVNQTSVPVKTATVIYVNLEPKMEPKAFGQLLEFIYTGQVQFNDDMNVKNLIHLAFAFKVEPLKKKCLLYLQQQLRVENVTLFLDLVGCFIDTFELEELILKFMARNAEAVCFHATWLVFVKLNPELAVKAMKRMVVFK